jgi:RNA polymerase sigma-70 factor (ECF subfamily)
MLERESQDWNQIVERHAHRVLRVALRVLGSVQDAEDVTQEVFVEAFRLSQISTVRCWTGLLVRLATLRSLDRLRRARTGANLRESDRITLIEPFHEAAAAELADRLRQAIGQLPDQQAAVFVMHHFDGLSRDEISTALEISAEAVSTALYKARQRLQNLLADFDRGAVK